QFGLSRDGAPVELPVDLTPDVGFQGSDLLGRYVNSYEQDILQGVFEVPLEYEGMPFRAGASLNFSEGWSSRVILNPDARLAFSVHTCNGCHSPETGTNFRQVEPRNVGSPSVVSGFLRGIAVTDSSTGRVTVFNDLGRRKLDLEGLACREDDVSASRS